MDFVPSTAGCLVCLNSTENLIFVPTEESQKIFNVCCSYVKEAINIEYLIKNSNENNNQLSFCKGCLDSSFNLCQLVEQLTNLKKEIVGLTDSFSETISKRRCEVTENKRKKQVNQNANFRESNKRTADLHNVLDGSLSQTTLSSKSRNRKEDTQNISLYHHGQLNELPESCNEFVKIECDEVIPDDEDFGTNNLFCHNEERTKRKSGADLKPKIISSKSLSELVGSVRMPQIVLERIQNDNRSSKSIITANNSKERKSGINLRMLPNRSSSICNSTVQKVTEQYKMKGKNFHPTVSNYSKNVISRSKLILQARIHPRERSFKCPICKKGFYNSSALKRHCKSHTGERPHKCGICDKSFTQSSTLKVHERVHTGERPFPCVLCDRSFMRSYALKEHERTHSGETPFKCTYCEMTFAYSSARWKHQKKMHIDNIQIS